MSASGQGRVRDYNTHTYVHVKQPAGIHLGRTAVAPGTRSLLSITVTSNEITWSIHSPTVQFP